MHKDQPGSTSEEEPTPPVTPTKTGNKGWEDETHEKEKSKVILVLPSNDSVAAQVRHIGNTDLASRLDQHPADVSPPETFVCGIRVELGVGISVMRSVTSRPPLDRALYGTSASYGKSVLQGNTGII